MPPANNTEPKREPTPGVPSPEQQSWGTLLAIVVIVLMVVVGAFYAWGKRISEEHNLVPVTTE